ncbi:MAG: hypothetical protein WC648_01790 [Candidatus Paceibacterota bacterium]|jgi:hypothetical protein
MNNKIGNNNSRSLSKVASSGFLALSAVLVLVVGGLSFSLITMSAILSYSESVNKRELRIQSRLNLTACLDALEIMSMKDYFMSGSIEIRQFGCHADVTNDLEGNFSYEATANLEGIISKGNRTFSIND